MTAVLALLVLIAFFCWLYLHESARLDRQERMSDAWLDRYRRQR